MNQENRKTVVVHEDIYAKGYGIIPQAVMFDVTLNIKSKALYAYFCSFSGAGHYVYPSRDTILNDMNMSKCAYYEALNPLIDAGYIAVEKAKGFINKNVYKISNKPRYVNNIAYVPDNTNKSTLAFEGINANGFGIIPKKVMCDNELTVAAKALLAFFYSLAASGACAFPERTLILNTLNISKTTYYKTLNLIIDRGYVIVKTRRSKNGRFAINNYVLAEKPQPCPKKQDNTQNVINTEVSPCPKKQDNENCRVLNSRTLPCPKKQDNNNIIFNSNSNITTSNHITSTTTTPTKPDENRNLIHKLTEIKRFEKMIPECEKSDNPHIRQLAGFAKTYLKVVDIICELAENKQPLVYNGATIKQQDFIAALKGCTVNNKLTTLVEEIVYHFEILRTKYTIKNPKQYIKPVIWQHIENFDFNTDWWCE